MKYERVGCMDLNSDYDLKISLCKECDLRGNEKFCKAEREGPGLTELYQKKEE